jgi:Cupin-like domain
LQTFKPTTSTSTTCSTSSNHYLSTTATLSERMTQLSLSILCFLLVTSWAVFAEGETISDNTSKVVELDIDNFEDTIQAKDWTCMLIYDPWDDRLTYEHTLILEDIYDRLVQRTPTSGIPVTLARLNGRKHAHLREEYSDNRGGRKHPPGTHTPFAHGYHNIVDLYPNSILTMTNETLLEFSMGSPFWPPLLVLLAPNYNVYGQVDLNLLTGDMRLKTAVLDRWLMIAMQGDWRVMTPLMETKYNIQAEMNRIAEAHADNSFPFGQYERELAEQESQPRDNISSDNQQSTALTRRAQLRLLLENDSKLDGREANNNYFTYKKAKVVKVRKSLVYLETLGAVIDEYLAWTEGYEVSWSPERKARENEQSNFGFFLNQMNQQVHELVDAMMDENRASRKGPKMQELLRTNPKFDNKMEIPNLKRYFQEMVFGPGRHVSSLRKVLDSFKSALGETAEERRQTRYDINATALPLVSALRDKLTVHAAAHDNLDRYSLILANLATDWHNILREFQNNLSKHYLKYLKTHPRPDGNNFPFQKMDVIDMKDPTNYELLTNYDDFHARYTLTGTPVILSNVELTRQKVTMDYLVSECRAMEVTKSVQVSRNVGERSAGKGWGGLQAFVLPDSLLNGERRKPPSKHASEHWGDLDTDEPGSEGNGTKQADLFDRSVTMEQFAILTERLDNLYLHDMGLPDTCDRLLYDDGTPYSKRQKFQLPTVMGGFDLTQRLSHSVYSSSWPSLFVGKKGSNSKLHMDSGATGFFMYLFSGRKRWIVYNPTERVHIYERIDQFTFYPDVLAMGKDEEWDQFFSDRFPLLHRAEGAYEIIQEPGQLVYIPPSCPHAVHNLEDTIGLAMNIVPRDGIANHFHEEIHASAAFGVFDLAMSYLMFEDTAENLVATKDPLYATWAEYKSQY